MATQQSVNVTSTSTNSDYEILPTWPRGTIEIVESEVRLWPNFWVYTRRAGGSERHRWMEGAQIRTCHAAWKSLLNGEADVGWWATWLGAERRREHSTMRCWTLMNATYAILPGHTPVWEKWVVGYFEKRLQAVPAKNSSHAASQTVV